MCTSSAVIASRASRQITLDTGTADDRRYTSTVKAPQMTDPREENKNNYATEGKTTFVNILLILF